MNFFLFFNFKIDQYVIERMLELVDKYPTKRFYYIFIIFFKKIKQKQNKTKQNKTKQTIFEFCIKMI
jgi:hypothetical protein